MTSKNIYTYLAKNIFPKELLEIVAGKGIFVYNREGKYLQIV